MPRRTRSGLFLLVALLLADLWGCGGGGSSAATAPATIPAPAITAFAVVPGSVTAGGSASLSFSFSGGTGAVDQGIGAVVNGGAQTVAPTATTTYTLTVTGASGATVAVTATLTVLPGPAAPAITSFTLTPSTVTAGATGVLAFTFSGGTGVIDQGVGPVTSPGTRNVAPAATTPYTLTVTNAAGAATTATLTLTVVPPPVIAAFTCSPTSVAAGTAGVLAFTFTGGTGAIDQGVGAVTSPGTRNVAPTATTTYTLTVTNGSGASVTAPATLTVTGAPPPATHGITYLGNGNTSGTPPADPGGYAAGAQVTVLGNTGGLAQTGASFKGWNTLAGGTGTAYAPGATLTMGNAAVTLYAAWTATVATGTWTVWRSGINSGNYTAMAVAANHDLFLADRNTFTVYKSNTQTAAPFTPLPTTGMALVNAQFLKLTTNALNEPVVGVFAGANGTQNAPGTPLLYRFDSAAKQWVAATVNTGIWPNLGIFDLKTGPDGTIWACVKWGSWILKSTDNGSTFTCYDLNVALSASGHADYFPIHVGNGTTSASVGATYSVGISPDNVVYTATETGSLFYSADLGATWHPVSLDYQNPASSMVRTMTGNSAGLGFTADHKVIMFGRGRTLYDAANAVTALNSDGNFLVRVDQSAQTTVNGSLNLPPYSWSSGLECARIVTTASGQLFLHSDKPVSGAQWGLYTSTDNGLTWQPCNTGITTAFDLNQTYALVADGNTVLVLASGTLWQYVAP